jgi:hypothetical protein
MRQIDINVTEANVPDLILRRIAETHESTFGVLLWKYVPFAVTVENVWLDNKPRLSCIPSGDYRVIRCRKSPDYNFDDSPSYGDTFQVFDVPGRSHILFHWGNTHKNTEGCVIVANSYGQLHGHPAVMGSKNISGAGFNAFKNLTRGLDEFSLRIIDHTRTWN